MSNEAKLTSELGTLSAATSNTKFVVLHSNGTPNNYTLSANALVEYVRTQLVANVAFFTANTTSNTYTAAEEDDFIVTTFNGANSATIYLPNTSPIGKRYTIKSSHYQSKNLIITSTGLVIDDANTYSTNSAYGSITAVKIGNYYLVESKI